MRRRCDCFGNFLARTEATIDELAVDQTLQRAFIGRHVFGLAPHWLFPADAEPSEIFENRGFELSARAALVNVFNAQ